MWSPENFEKFSKTRYFLHNTEWLLLTLDDTSIVEQFLDLVFYDSNPQMYGGHWETHQN